MSFRVRKSPKEEVRTQKESAENREGASGGNKMVFGSFGDKNYEDDEGHKLEDIDIVMEENLQSSNSIRQDNNFSVPALNYNEMSRDDYG